MALEPQEIEISLTLGMATKPSAELQEPTHMRLVQNLHWRGLGEIEKRPADDTSATVAAPSGSEYTEGDACGIIRRGDDVCVVSGQHGVMPYSTKAGEFRYTRADTLTSATPGTDLKYAPASYELSRQPVHSTQWSKSSNGIKLVSAAQYSGVHVVAWVEPADTTRIRFKAIDPATSTVLATAEHTTLSNSTFYVDACEYTESGKEGVLVAYIDGAAAPYTVSTVRYDYATNAFVADSNLTTDAGGAFAIVKNGTRIYFGYQKNTGAILIVEDRTVGAVTTTHTGNHSAALGVAIVKGTNRDLIVSCTATDAYAEVFGTPANVITPITAGTGSFYGITAARETLSGTTDDGVMYVNKYFSGATGGIRLMAQALNFDATTVSAGGAEHLPHCRAIAGAFTLRGRAHVVAAAKPRWSDVGAWSCFVARWRGHASAHRRHDAVAKILHDRAFVPLGVTFENTPSNVYVDTSNVAWITSLADVTPDGTASLDGDLPQTIFLCRLDAGRPMAVPYVELSPGVVMAAGAIAWEFDGDQVGELAPLIAPDMVIDVSSGTGETGTFSFRAVYRWVDRAGRLHQAAGPARSTGTIANKQIDIYVSRCPLTAYDGNTTLAKLEVDLYGTENNGSTYVLLEDGLNAKLAYTTTTADGLWYKFTDVAAPPVNSSDITLDIIDGTVIAPEPTPGFSYVAKISDRAWAIDTEDRTRVWFSKPLVAGFASEWSVVNTLVIDDDCTAIVDSGGYPTVLARGGVYQIAGPGPDATGVGSFSPAQRLPFEVDCLDPVSVCRTPLGVVFRGRRGIYVLADMPRAEPGLLVDPETLTAPDQAEYRTRVVFQEQTNEIHVAVPAYGYRLVYNIVEQKWAKYLTSGPTLVYDLAMVRGKLWRLERTVAGADVLRSEKLFSEDGASYNGDTNGTQINTPWYRLDQVNGMARLWRAWFAFAMPTDIADITSIVITYYANNNDASSQDSATWTGAELAALYDPSTGEAVVRLPFVPNLQIVHSFRFTIACTFSGATSGPRPLSMRLRFGKRPSLSKRNKVPAKG